MRLVMYSFVALLAVNPTAFAAEEKEAKVEKSEDEEGSKPMYGMAGCGLGSLIISSDTVGGQLGAWLFNGIYANQTYAISSGTSNCVENRTDVAEMEQNVFVTANLTTLTRDAAQGDGDVIEGLAEVLGCYDIEGQKRLKEVSRAQHAQLFASNDPEVVLDTYLDVIQSDPILAQKCVKAS
jgi:hypothetical protein